MARSAIHTRLELAVESGSGYSVCEVLKQHRVHRDIHRRICAEAPAHATSCDSCAALLSAPLRRRQFPMIRLLLKNGAYPSAKICALDHRYGRDRASTPLKRAVESGSLDDVRQLLTSPVGAAADEINWHPRICIKRQKICDDNRNTCVHCDSPLMAAVRRQDVAMMRLLVEHGASLSDEKYEEHIEIYDTCGCCGLSCLNKTILIVAMDTENEEVMTELVASGADANRWLGQIGAILSEFLNLFGIWQYFWVIKLLVQLGADPNAAGEEGKYSVLSKVLSKYYFNRNDSRSCSAALQTIHTLLPVTRHLSAILGEKSCILRSDCEQIQQECVTPFLQHGARIDYCKAYLIRRWGIHVEAVASPQRAIHRAAASRRH